jgi:hypothetical protein
MCSRDDNLPGGTSIEAMLIVGGSKVVADRITGSVEASWVQ